MLRHCALEDTYLEVTTLAGMYDCKWTYRLSHGRKGWQLKCRNFPEMGGPDEEVRRVIEVDAECAGDIISRLSRIKINMAAPHDSLMIEGSENVLTVGSSNGNIKVRWYDGSAQEEVEQFAEDFTSLAQSLICLRRSDVGSPVRLVQWCGVQFMDSPRLAEDLDSLTVGDRLRIGLCDSDAVKVECPGKGLVGYLVHPDTPKIRRLIADRRELRAVVAGFDDVGEPTMRMHVVIADVAEN